jgi:hypothetical protein
MIAGAVAVRSLIDDDGSSASGSSTGGNSSNGDEPVRVRCATVAAAACDALRDAGFTVRTEPAGRTADALAQAGPTDDLGFDVWITAGSWPGMIEAQRRSDLAGGLLDEPQDIGARSPAVIVGRTNRTELLGATCGLTWTCIGDSVGSTWADLGGSASWGSPAPGHSPPGANTEGLLTTAQLTADFLGRTSYASNDLDNRYQAWLAQLEEAVPDHTPPAGTPFDQLLLTPAFFDAVGTIEAVAAPAVATSRDRDRLTITIPEPIVTADLVAVAPLGQNSAAQAIATRDDVREALAAAAWRVEGLPTIDVIDDNVALPESDNLPPAGVLIALTDRWNEVT